MQARGHARLGVVEQVAHPGLDQHRSQAGRAEELLARQPSQAAERGRLFGPTSERAVRRRDADDLVIGRSAVDG